MRLAFAVALASGAGVQLACADTFYDFTFTGNGGAATIMGGLLDVNAANQVVSVSGTASGLAAQGIPNGRFTRPTIVSAVCTYASPSSYMFNFISGVGGNPSTQFFFSGSATSVVGGFLVGGAAVGTSTVTPQGAPAPVPGGGLLSFIALVLGALTFKRKAILALAQRLMGSALPRAV